MKGTCGLYPARSCDASVDDNMAALMHPAAVASPDNSVHVESEDIHNTVQNSWCALNDQNDNWVSSGMVLNGSRTLISNRCV